MNVAVFRRTFLDQLRVRTYIFVGILVLLAFLLAYFAPQGLGDEENWSDDDRAEFEKLDGTDLFAAFLGMPLVNGRLILVLFAVLMAASTVANEWQDKTGFLLFSKPVPRFHIVLAKVMGVYAWILIGIAAATFALIVGAGVAGIERPATGGLFIGVFWLALTMLPVVALSAYIAFAVRRPIPSVALAVLALAVVAPTVAQAGFLLSMQDDDFRHEGLYYWYEDGEEFAPVDECMWPRDHEWGVQYLYEAESEAELDQAYTDSVAVYDAIHACRVDTVGDVDAFYTDRGASPREFQYEVSKCELDVIYNAWNGHGDEPTHLRPQPDYDACRPEYGEEERDAEEARRAAFLSKFERPLVDAPRYLSPTAVVATWKAFADWDLDEAPRFFRFIIQEGQFSLLAEILYSENAAGAVGEPASRVGAVVGVIGHSVLWTGLAAWSVNRRDLA